MHDASRSSLPLVKAFPQLGEKLPWVGLGLFPSPVEPAGELGRSIHVPKLWIKRDDLCGEDYGSNKIRKLEFLLGEALERGFREVFTIGFAGSNHALATAICAQKWGLGCTSLLMPQAGARYVQQNLLAGLGAGARLVPCRHLLSVGLKSLWLKRRAYAIPPGGSSPLGVMGYVNAALELRDQIQAGLLPEPDRIYVPMGSMGTTVGLSIGLQAAGLKTQIEAIRVIEKHMASPSALARLIRESLSFLRQRDTSFPFLQKPGSNLRVREEFLGPGYARFTPEGQEATELMQAIMGIELVGTYSAKAFAALIADGRAGHLGEQTVLFWNTFNSRSLQPWMQEHDSAQLPRAFQVYFDRV